MRLVISSALILGSRVSGVSKDGPAPSETSIEGQPADAPRDEGSCARSVEGKGA